MPSRKQHKFSIVDSCFDWLYFLTLIRFLLYFDVILHFSIMTCFSFNSMWQEWCLALQKSSESVNFLINNLKINFAYSKSSVLDLVIEYSLKSFAFILTDILFHSSETWYLFNNPNPQFLYMIYTVRQVFSSINHCDFEIHGGILIFQKLMWPLRIISAYLCKAYLGHIQNLI